MDSTISFNGVNYGSEIAINNGLVTNEFRVPWDAELPDVPGAAFDSYENQHKDPCLPGTRTDILDQISTWALSPHKKGIFWLNGIAGTGKSTISRTMAKLFSKAQSLGASFFFERGEGDRGNARKLFPTIARQLAITIPQLVPVLHQAVRDNPGIVAKAMREQFQKLLLQPLQKLERSAISARTMIIVLDALDECEGDSDIRLILQLLPQLQNLSTLCLRVLLTSRPELPIRLGFSKIANDDYVDFFLHDIPLGVIKHDISLFFDHRLAEIRTERCLPSTWPGERDLRRLVELSVPSFIFAATICRIFEEPHWDPKDSLTEILTYQNDQSNLNGTYLPVLDRLLSRQHEKQKEKLVSEFQQVIGAIVILESPLSVKSLSNLLGLPTRVINLRLSALHSVLRVPNDETIPIRLFHLSFRDFLLDPEIQKKTPLGIKERDIHDMLTSKCLLMCQNLRRNICQLPSDGTQRAEVDHQTIQNYLSPELQYACRYWAHHLLRCANPTHLAYNAFSFLRVHFLHWVEALSLLGLTSEILSIINCLQTSICGYKSSLLSEFLHDAKRFILKNRQIIDQAPLQVYCAGLIFAPRQSKFRTLFEHELPHWICQLPLVEENWGAELQTLEGHSASVQSVAFSPDSHLLVSGSDDKTVRLWDPATGVLRQTLEGHAGSVQSVAFSPHGHLLASGSNDKTVRLWDPMSGALLQILEGHLGSVTSVTFSPDSRLLASGSDDKTVRLWDPATGVLRQTLEGHAGSVQSVAFSPHGHLLASGSNDKTVRLWDPMSGALLQILEGHSGSVQSVAFSPTDRSLACCCDNETVHIWDIDTGILGKTLHGCSRSLLSVVFSPDGQLLASGSVDWIVHLWNLETGAIERTLDGQGSLGFMGCEASESVAFSAGGQLLASCSANDTVRLWDLAVGELPQILKSGDSEPPVQVMAFSPDGHFLASGSYESSVVRLWDANSGTLAHIFEGHSSPVNSVIFSPDSRMLVSCSCDHTICLWDLVMGTVQKTISHSHTVYSVAFSPGGRLLASCSDHKVRLWDVATGVLQQTFEGSDSADLRLNSLDGFTSAAFSPDGRLLASGSHCGIVCIWDLATGALRHLIDGHSNWVHPLVFSPDSALLATGSIDRTVCLWALTGSVLNRIGSWEFIEDFCVDGLYLQTGLGFLDIDISFSPSVNLNVSIEDEKWIKINGERILWLPVGSRPSCFKVKGNTLALGHALGEVSFIRFCI